MTIKIQGELEIDADRGVIYFHGAEGFTVLRISKLPTPVPDPQPGEMLDIIHMFGTSWKRH